MPEDGTTVSDDRSAAKTKDTKTDDKGKEQLTVHIRVASPFNTFFDEEALSISAENDTGPFDILPHHHNFITLLNACEIVVRTVRGDFRIQISGGVMHVKADKIVVFLNV